MMRIHRRKNARLNLESLEARDVPASFGVPWPDATHLTLSFVPDGTRVGSGRSDLFARMDQHASRAIWESTVLRAFQTWAAVANIEIAVVADDGSPLGTSGPVQHDPRFGDIRISATATSNSVLAFSVPYDPFFAGGWSGDVVLNDHVNFQGPGEDLYGVMLHEAGHVLGIDGSSNPASAMYEHAGVTHSGLIASDVAQVVALYGPRPATPAVLHNTSQQAISIDQPLGTSNGYVGATPLVEFGRLHQPGDVLYYNVNTLDQYTGPITVRLQTAGISLLAPQMTVYDEDGNILGLAMMPSFQGGILTLTLTSSHANSEIFIRIEAASPGPFNVGRFGLAISFDGRTTVSPSQLDSLMRLPLSGLADHEVRDLLENSGDTLLNDDHGLDGTATTAAGLLPTDGDISGQHFRAIGSLSAIGQIDFFRVVAPRIGAAHSVTLTATVQAFAINGTVPAIVVCDPNGAPIAATILANGNGIYTVQLRAAVPNSAYFIKVGNAASRLGNYDLAVTFGTVAASLSTMVDGSLSAASPTASGALIVAQDQIFQFLLNVGPTNTQPGAGVRVSIREQNGREVVNLVTTPGGTVSGPLPLLLAGAYTVDVTVIAAVGRPVPNLTFSIQGSSLSDPIGPVVVNPTSSPTAFTSPISGMPYYFALPAPVVTSSAYLMYFPGLTSKATLLAGIKVIPLK